MVRKVKHNLTSNDKTKTCSKSISTVKTLKDGKREMSVIRCRRDSNYKHPTQKPIELMERLIKLTTKENDIVLDPFMGGGSTAVACVKNNRRFVGIEIDKEYFDIACNRIEEAYKSI